MNTLCINVHFSFTAWLETKKSKSPCTKSIKTLKRANVMKQQRPPLDQHNRRRQLSLTAAHGGRLSHPTGRGTVALTRSTNHHLTRPCWRHWFPPQSSPISTLELSVSGSLQASSVDFVVSENRSNTQQDSVKELRSHQIPGVIPKLHSDSWLRHTQGSCAQGSVIILNHSY